MLGLIGRFNVPLPRRQTYRAYLTVGRYELGPHAILQTTAFLLACGIDVHATNHAGQTAVQLAADKDIALFDDREALLKLLLGAGSNLNQGDAAGDTPLHRLAHSPKGTEAEDTMTTLLSSGANLNATN
jgi:ankyrin repeat protein